MEKGDLLSSTVAGLGKQKSPREKSCELGCVTPLQNPLLGATGPPSPLTAL